MKFLPGWGRDVSRVRIGYTPSPWSNPFLSSKQDEGRSGAEEDEYESTKTWKVPGTSHSLSHLQKSGSTTTNVKKDHV